MCSCIVKPTTPTINWGNSLSKGLVFDAPFFDRGGTAPIETISKKKGSFIGSPTWKKDVMGPIIDNATSGGNNGINFTTTPNLVTLPLITFEFLILIRTFDGVTFTRLLAKGSDGSAYFFVRQTTVSGELQSAAGYAISSNSYKVTGLSTNTWYHIFISHDMTNTSYQTKWWINGVSVTPTSVSSASGAQLTDNSNIDLMNRAAGARGLDGKISHFRIWKKIFTNNEVKRLYENPWQIYKKPRYSSWGNFETINIDKWMQNTNQPMFDRMGVIGY